MDLSPDLRTFWDLSNDIPQKFQSPRLFSNFPSLGNRTKNFTILKDHWEPRFLTACIVISCMFYRKKLHMKDKFTTTL